MHVDQTTMLSGLIKFTVDGIPCPDTNGVGDNTGGTTGPLGGVFNCGLTGTKFKLYCD